MANNADEQVPAVKLENAVYLVPYRESLSARSPGSLDLLEIVRVILAGKWTLLAVTVPFVLAGLIWVFLAPVVYRAEVVLIPAEKRTGVPALGAFAALASVAGISVGAGGGQEPLAVLRSRDFSRKFIEKHELLTALFPEKWDASSGRWKDTRPEKIPDIRDAVMKFQRSVFAAAEDRRTGIVRVTFNWSDPEKAALLANDIVRQLNDDLRVKAVDESQRNIDFLRQEMISTNVVSLQQAMGGVLENEMQKLMMAKGNEEFAFKVVDSATAPRRQSSPRRVMLLLLSAIVGGLLGVTLVLTRHYYTRRLGREDGAS